MQEFADWVINLFNKSKVGLLCVMSYDKNDGRAV